MEDDTPEPSRCPTSPDVTEAVAVCPSCRTHVIADEAAHVIYNEGRSAPDWRFSILLCRGCGGPLVLYGEDGVSFNDPIWLYPTLEATHPAVPSVLRVEMMEALKLFYSGHPAPAVLMCGRTLEGLAYLHGVEEPTLMRSLQALEKKGLLSAAMVTWAQELRGLRNSAAHFEKHSQVTAEDAEDAIALTVAILDYVYVFAKRFEAFQARRHRE